MRLSRAVRRAGPQQNHRRVLLEVRSRTAPGPDHEPAVHVGDRSRDDVGARVGADGDEKRARAELGDPGFELRELDGHAHARDAFMAPA